MDIASVRDRVQASLDAAPLVFRIQPDSTVMTTLCCEIDGAPKTGTVAHKIPELLAAASEGRLPMEHAERPEPPSGSTLLLVFPDGTIEFSWKVHDDEHTSVMHDYRTTLPELILAASERRLLEHLKERRRINTIQKPKGD